MTDTLLASQTTESTDATTTPDGTATVDTAPAGEQQQTEAQESTSQETETKPEEPEKKAPELYEFTVPEGMPKGFSLDDDVADSLAKVSREFDLTQEQAQQIVNEVWPVIHRRAEEQQKAMHEQWVVDLRADKEIGGRELEKNLGVAKKLVDTYGSDDLKELLFKGPLGDHPEVVRFLVTVGRTMSEDTFVGGTSRGGESVDLNDEAAMAKKLYPKSI